MKMFDLDKLASEVEAGFDDFGFGEICKKLEELSNEGAMPFGMALWPMTLLMLKTALGDEMFYQDLKKLSDKPEESISFLSEVKKRLEGTDMESAWTQLMGDTETVGYDELVSAVEQLEKDGREWTSVDVENASTGNVTQVDVLP